MLCKSYYHLSTNNSNKKRILKKATLVYLQLLTVLIPLLAYY